MTPESSDKLPSWSDGLSHVGDAQSVESGLMNADGTHSLGDDTHSVLSGSVLGDDTHSIRDDTHPMVSLSAGTDDAQSMESGSTHNGE